MTKYKIETWNRTRWKGTTRQDTTKQEVLVRRDKLGHFAKGEKNPVIKQLSEKQYGSGTYKVGIVHGKVVTRYKTASRNVNWYERKKEVIANRQIFKITYALNVPYQGTVYYGFRITAFHWSEKILNSKKEAIKERLIKFIENSLHYKRDEFWFNLYFGGSKPQLANAYKSDINTYVCQWTTKYGSVKKEESGTLESL